MTMLLPLWLVLALAFAIPEVSSQNEDYPPLWDSIPDNLANLGVHNKKVTINPWDYRERMAMYKILLNVTAPFFGTTEQDNENNVLWGLPLQHGWQFSSGRLQETLWQPSSGQNSGDQLSISTKSWWACMNYYLAAIPFLGAMDAGLFEGFPYGIVISPPDEFESDFCCSIDECRSFSPEVMDEWKAFFELMKTNQISDKSTRLVSKEDKALSYMWKAHVKSIKFALPRCSDRLRYHSEPEGNFGKDWANAVEFMAATNLPTDLRSTNGLQIFLPFRFLVLSDELPLISDFSAQQNMVLSTLQSINKMNRNTGGSLLRLWKKAMCSEKGKVAGRNLLQDMLTRPQMVLQTMMTIIRELVKNSKCEVENN